MYVGCTGKWIRTGQPALFLDLWADFSLVESGEIPNGAFQTWLHFEG